MNEEVNHWIQIAERELARPLACEILSTVACSQSLLLFATVEALGHGTDSVAAELAYEAWQFCAERMGWAPHSKLEIDHEAYWEICAEAEGILRNAWNPGDKHAF